MANKPHSVEVSRQSWCGSRSAMIVLAFSYAMDPQAIPAVRIARIHEETPIQAERESKLIELANECGFTLRFK